MADSQQRVPQFGEPWRTDQERRTIDCALGRVLGQAPGGLGHIVPHALGIDRIVLCVNALAGLTEEEIGRLDATLRRGEEIIAALADPTQGNVFPMVDRLAAEYLEKRGLARREERE